MNNNSNNNFENQLNHLKNNIVNNYFDKKNKQEESFTKTHNIIEQQIDIIPEIPIEIKENLKKIKKGSVGLLVLKGPIIGEKFYIKKDLFKIGRSNDSDILLDDITVSRQHAVIKKNNNQFEIEDLNSLNGTYLNGEIINKSVSLKNLDRIQIGKYVFIFFNF